jgi:hypothetical protein
MTRQCDLDEVTCRLDRAADIVERRFAEIWRIADRLLHRPTPALQ